ncbi:MAG: hypothetical protein ABSG32_29685 [Terriglobia bacterium]|jgi:hypothetical protein
MPGAKHQVTENEQVRLIEGESGKLAAQNKKNCTFKAGMLLKTKQRESVKPRLADEFMKTSELHRNADELLKTHEIG